MEIRTLFTVEKLGTTTEAVLANCKKNNLKIGGFYHLSNEKLKYLSDVFKKAEERKLLGFDPHPANDLSFDKIQWYDNLLISRECKYNSVGEIYEDYVYLYDTSNPTEAYIKVDYMKNDAYIRYSEKLILTDFMKLFKINSKKELELHYYSGLGHPFLISIETGDLITTEKYLVYSDELFKILGEVILKFYNIKPNTVFRGELTCNCYNYICHFLLYSFNFPEWCNGYPDNKAILISWGDQGRYCKFWGYAGNNFIGGLSDNVLSMLFSNDILYGCFSKRKLEERAEFQQMVKELYEEYKTLLYDNKLLSEQGAGALLLLLESICDSSKTEGNLDALVDYFGIYHYAYDYVSRFIDNKGRIFIDIGNVSKREFKEKVRHPEFENHCVKAYFLNEEFNYVFEDKDVIDSVDLSMIFADDFVMTSYVNSTAVLRIKVSHPNKLYFNVKDIDGEIIPVTFDKVDWKVTRETLGLENVTVGSLKKGRFYIKKENGRSVYFLDREYNN
jgi:hypothetical protein